MASHAGIAPPRGGSRGRPDRGGEPAAGSRPRDTAPRGVAAAEGTSDIAAPVPARPWRRAEAPADALDAFAAEAHGVTPSPTDTVASLPLGDGFLGAGAPAREPATPQRGLAVAAAVAAVLLGGFVVTRMTGPGTTAVASTAPLELLSLRHEREGSLLSVVGLVRNPPAANALDRVSAVVLLFDRDGAFVTSATAPLDFVTLASGDESPFVVKVDAPPTVARYRVSFRADGGTLTHVDRRNENTDESPVALTRQ
ncbi:MAG: hypothetical protein R2712_20020 [Vicinamibacterales bacterium]